MFLGKLRQLGLEEKTIVPSTSDHGDWGDRYGIVNKTGDFNKPLIRVPGVLAMPGMSNDRRIKAQISNINVMLTVFDYLNLSYPGNV